MADLAEGLVDNPLDERFEKATKFLQHSTDLFKQDQLLQFYGLYKQATVGVCNIPKPAIYSMGARAKWYAWDKVKHLDTNAAKQEYVRLMDQLAPDWGESSAGEAGWVSVSRPKRLSESGPDETNKSLIDRIKEDDLEGVRDMIRQDGICTRVNVLDHEGLAAIHWAADRGNVDILASLLTVDGIDINLQGADGQTALHYASSCGNVECLQLLLKHGADRSIRDEEGETCSDVAYNHIIKACLV
ncbi:acyl-CoA-binding domain-containing protein 6-like [Anopheles maculipalpis]|uniref:acyl-CoA-binding domain-containing protein 6-like n=1 Tax=Anopheles maculipalpis TaxID=1496333 RepID=UPI0021599A7E|nr:acyl-CoA-binding domain-containing protein 6-like [Anopheles maculipalpis]